MAELYPNGTATVRSHTMLVMTLALLLAALIGAGLMFVGWAMFGDDDAVVVPNASAPATAAPDVTTPAEIASARALDRVKNEAATAAAIGNGTGITKERAAAPTSSLAGTTAQEAKTDAKVHAEAMRGIAAARDNLAAKAGTHADGAAAVEAGTVVKGDEKCLDTVVGHC